MQSFRTLYYGLSHWGDDSDCPRRCRARAAPASGSLAAASGVAGWRLHSPASLIRQRVQCSRPLHCFSWCHASRFKYRHSLLSGFIMPLTGGTMCKSTISLYFNSAVELLNNMFEVISSQSQCWHRYRMGPQSQPHLRLHLPPNPLR